ncbi:DegT/DnrJ/EryC1/StrS family aminotransferase [Methanolobus sp. ZRKC2]|uniref:DegT/DnrJ/EryC1/StrS family aminotransferase n=1 Tax=Methanolobus sp. ZRKC2 TaxID=3125783 RepID=UPI003248A89C
MIVPFVDLKRQYLSIKPEINNAIESVIEDTAFVRGKYVTDFENAYAEKYGVNHCISVANGTDAIYITLKALGIGLGDEVITVANSWISTSETITQAGAKVVFVDIEPDYFTIDVSKIEEKITSKTKAIILVHLYGQPAEIDTIKDICDKHSFYLIEDCAQAHFASYKNQKVGTFGIAGTFSFYPGKNLGAYGDAGAIITNNGELADKMRMFANHGSLKKHKHQIEGINSRMDGLQAAILSVKLPYIDEWNEKRYHNALLYNELLSDVEEITVPKIRPNATHIFHVYSIRTNKRDKLQTYLEGNGISTAIHYPVALPFMQAYKYLGHHSEDFPVAYQYQNEILSLPMYPELSTTSVYYVVDKIKEFFKQ